MRTGLDLFPEDVYLRVSTSSTECIKMIWTSLTNCTISLKSIKWKPFNRRIKKKNRYTRHEYLKVRPIFGII
ncbi:hypothetical protein EUGRSUZ_A02269 [Eucalyptus grandis]|uniref:Uncharacterized protein n=2 Tax=Eucalyptus grandis TaxID=71139 RepID=A0ACC3M5V7_EUCGR|nr:hypothetical protein EUGRSUZ_A02269 [Eucalyptus grandis]